MFDPAVVAVATFLTGGTIGTIFGKLWDRSATKKDLIFKEKKDLYLAYVDACILVMKEAGEAFLETANAIAHNKMDINLSHATADMHRVTAIAHRTELFASARVINSYEFINGLMSNISVLVLALRETHSHMVKVDFSGKDMPELSRRVQVIQANFKIWQSRFYLQLDRSKIEMRRDLSGYWTLMGGDRAIAIDPGMAFLAAKETLEMPWLPTTADWEQGYRILFPPIILPKQFRNALAHQTRSSDTESACMRDRG